MTERLLKMALMNTLLAPFLFGGLAIPISKADDTVRSTDGTRRFTVRDRGDRYKAIINDRGEEVGYGVKRGDSWTYFVDKDAYTVDDDE